MQFALPASLPIEFPAIVGPGSLIAIRGSFLLIGWALEETTGAAAANCYLRDGERSADAPLRVPIRLAANESTRDSVTGLGIVFERALLVDVAAGSIRGAVFVLPTEHFQTDAGVILVGSSRPGTFEPLSLSLEG